MNVEIFPNYNESICVSKKEIIKNCNENNICIIKANFGNKTEIEIAQDCMISVRGNEFCPLNQKEIAWKKYLNTYQNYYDEQKVELKRNTEMHFPVYKDIFNNYEISQLFWYYKEWQYIIEADICTKEFFFLNNKATILNYSLIYLLYIYIFLLF